MSRRRRQTLSPTLFPFLAVLVCTLGTLILLLALVAENATTAAASESQQAAEVEPEPEIHLTAQHADSLIAEADFRVQHLVSIRDAQVADIENRRDQVGHLDEHMSRLKQELKRLGDEAKMASGEIEAKVVDRQMLLDLQKQIESEAERVVQLREANENQTPRVVIVPHKGPNGTDRRPVYLECTSDGITIWPEGIELSKLLLEESSEGANPLDAALRVIRNHAMKHYGDTVAPYPLLVVRPEGVKTYAAARYAMNDWDDQFGYELVPAHVKLAYDAPDPALKERVDYAIRQAVIQQNGRQRVARRLSGSGGRTTAGKAYPTLSAASMDRQGRASGFRDHRDNRLAVNPYTSSGFGTHGDGQAGTGADAASELDRQLRDAVGDGAQRVGDLSINGDVGDLATGTSIDGREANTALAELGGDISASGSEISMFGGDVGSSDPRIKSAQENPYTRNPNLQGTQTADSEHGSSADVSSSNQLAQQASPAGQVDSPSSNQQSNQSTPGENVTKSVGAGAAQSPPPRGAMSGPPMPNAGTPPPMTMTNPPPQVPESVRKLVRRQGADWALPRSVAQSHGTAVVRSIRVQCYPDRFVLLPPRGSGRTEIFGLSDGDIHRATMELATAIRDRIVGWGAALPGGRWQPKLTVEIMPRGDSRFHQLRTLMSGSGMEIEGRAAR